MEFSKADIKAVLFDYGNTLVAFGPRQTEVHYAALEDELKRLFGHCDLSRLKAIRERQAVAPFSNDLKENDLKVISGELIQGIYSVAPKESQINALIQARYRAFIDCVALESDIFPLLRRLKRRYRLGLISNYPCGRSIRDSLVKLGLGDIFEVVIVSGDVGYIKPHKRPFQTALDHLGLDPNECVYVGDNWVADVQGAKGVGMYAVLTSQYTPYEMQDQVAGKYHPDVIIRNIRELEALLLNG